MPLSDSQWILGSSVFILVALLQPATTVADERSVLRADTAMADAVAARDVEGFRAFLHPEVRYLGEKRIQEGPDALLKSWADFFNPESFRTLRWQPLVATVAASGDLAMTTGTFQLVERQETSEALSQEGRYITLWRRSKDSEWRVILDAPWVPGDPEALQLTLEMEAEPPRAILQGPGTMAVRAVRAYSSEGGDLVYASGDYRSPAEVAGEPARTGVFLGVWGRQDDGSWALLISSFPPPQ